MNAIADRMVPDRRSWEKSCRFMGIVATDLLQEVQKNLSASAGPSLVSRWLQWQYPTPVQEANKAIQNELRVILDNNPVIFLC